MNKPMSPKLLLHRANISKSALGFLQQYRDYMTTGELAETLSPIIRKVDDGSLMATPAVGEIAQAVMMHVIASDSLKLEQAIQKQTHSPTKGFRSSQAMSPPSLSNVSQSQKNWTAMVVDQNDVVQTYLDAKGEEKELRASGNDVSTLDRWLDRKLFAGSSDWHGVIEHSVMKVRTIVDRQDAIARLMIGRKGPVSKGQAKSAGKLSFGMKVRNDVSHFSRG